MNRKEFINIYWNYYISLEEDVKKMSQYISFTEDNFSTYSNEVIKLYLSVCSEVDVIFKLICEFNGDGNYTIGHYRKKILKLYSKLCYKEIKLCNSDNISFIPYESWSNTKDSPIWWSNYNNIKHNRSNNYKEGNLKNLLYALSGLYLLELLEFEKISNETNELLFPTQMSTLFKLSDNIEILQSIKFSIKTCIQENTTFELPLKYIYDNNDLKIYFESTLLIPNENYYEQEPQTGILSNIIVFDWEVPRDSNFYIEVKNNSNLNQKLFLK